MALIYRATGLKKYYGSHPALVIPEFSLEKGACLALMGRNGAGKSTFLRLLAFLEKPDQGELSFFGDGEPRERCSLLLQEPWLTRASVFRNVVLGLRLRGDRADLPARFADAMRACGFAKPEEFARRAPGSLSGGEKQRVALAARLILNPSVLLLDEPTTYVDAQSADCIFAALKRFRARGATIVCATHDRGLVDGLSAEIFKLESPANN